MADSVEKLAACTDDLEKLKSLASSKEKDLLGRIKSLENEEKTLQAVLESERKTCSTKLQGLGTTLEREQKYQRELTSALKDLEQIKKAWMPVWMSNHVQKIRPILSEASPYVEQGYKSAKYVWRKSVLPLAARLQNMGKRGISMAVDAVGRTWEERVPEKYRSLLATYVHKGWQALSLSVDTILPYAKTYFGYIKYQVTVVLRELSGMVRNLADMYPEQLGWAKKFSFPIAVFIVSFPVTFIGMPLLASKMQSRRSTPSKKKSSKKKKSSNKQSSTFR